MNLLHSLLHSAATSCIQQIQDSQENPAVAREDALQFIQFLLQYLPLRSSKVDDFYLIWKDVWHYLLVINSNLGPISYRFRDMASFPLKMHIFLPLHLTPNFKMFPLHRISQILKSESLDIGLIIRVKRFSPKI